MIRMNVDREQLETGVGLEKVVQKIIWYQIFWKDAIGKDIRLIDLQYKMYNSDLIDPFFLDRKLKLDLQHNLVKPLVDTSTSTFLGRVPDIVVNGTPAEKERASAFSLRQKHSEFEEEIYDAALNMENVVVVSWDFIMKKEIVSQNIVLLIHDTQMLFMIAQLQ